MNVVLRNVGTCHDVVFLHVKFCESIILCFQAMLMNFDIYFKVSSAVCLGVEVLVEWRCCTGENGAVCAMMNLTTMMLLSYADSWDTPQEQLIARLTLGEVLVPYSWMI